MKNLPAEIWFLIYQYFSFEELLTSFGSLNARLQRILFEYNSLHLNIQCLRRSKFQSLCNDHLPLIHQSLQSLRLSDHLDCLQQIDVFHQLGYTFDRFVNLRTLSVSHLDSLVLLNDIITQLQPLKHFTSLSLKTLDAVAQHLQFPLIFDRLWQLRQLANLHVTFDDECCPLFPERTSRSTSLKQVKLTDCHCSSTSLAHLLGNTPQLQHLEISIDGEGGSSPPVDCDQHASVHSLELRYSGSWPALRNILQLMPNLQRLQIIGDFNLLSEANDMSQFISQNLRNLRSLEFFNRYHLPRNTALIQRRNIALYRRFQRMARTTGLKEFPLRCDWKSSPEGYIYHFYTIPCIANRSRYLKGVDIAHSHSNAPALIDEQSYHRIPSLNYKEIPLSAELPFHFANLNHLQLPLSSKDPFDRSVVRFNRLVSLELSIQDENIQDSVQSILDEAIHLRRLIFFRWPMALIGRIRSASVRELDISGVSLDTLGQYFDKSQLAAFISGHWASQCVILRIAVDDSAGAVDLVTRLHNLQLLVVKCRDDRWSFTSDSNGNDPYLERLRAALPPTCRLIREPSRYGTTRIWIR